MAKQATELELLIKTTGVEKLRGLTSSLKKLKDTTVVTSSSTAKLLAHLKKQSANASQSINTTQALANSYRQLARNVDVTSKEFREATTEAARLEGQLKKMQAAANKGMGRGRIGGIAKTAGAIGAAGIFGGAEGAAGAAIGGIIGGAPGAITGGVVGAQVGVLTGALKESTEYSAALAKQRRALRLVIGDMDDYADAQDFLSDVSKKLAIPQDVITRQFTSLTASVLGAGLSIDDAKQSFLAISSSIRGTGGNLEDMKSALRATSQVFSKGKVSAEELRQQLGERLPGAFTLFAESMDKTPAELDKALEQGIVTLEDFVGFSEDLLKRYEKNAELLAQAPETAGDRLQTELSVLKDNVGQLLRPVGAEFQTTFTGIVNQINGASEALRKFLKIGEEYQEDKLKELLEEREKIISDISKLEILIPQTSIFSQFGSASRGELENMLAGSKEELELLLPKIAAIKLAIKDTLIPIKDVNDEAKETTTIFDNIKNGATSYLESIKNVGQQVQDATVNAFKGMEDALVNFVTTGKMNFADFTRSILADITRIIIRQTFITPLLGAFGITTNATGNVYDQGLKKFAKGGIVTQPTLFAYGSGGSGNFGLMGEQGAEAILPLKRGRSGNLGVEASGGATNIVVNVDASGSSVEGDEADGKSLGLALSAAIESELIKQKRPGGLLA